MAQYPDSSETPLPSPNPEPNKQESSRAQESQETDNNTNWPGWKGYRPYIIGFWAIFLAGLMAFGIFIKQIASGKYEELPSTEKLENPRTPLASMVYTSDSVLLGKYYSENRTQATYDEIEGPLTEALIATEDVRFYQHHGIDWKGVAAVPFYLFKGDKRGASTITQQLAKNLFERQNFSTVFEILVTKFKEWIIAVELERRYTKQEIITMYFNTVDFGSNAFGIKAASRTYFNKPPDSLRIQEAATLVGMLKATTRYNPRFNPEASKERRNVVLNQMSKYDYLNPVRVDSLQKLPVALNYKVPSHTRGMATYFREHLRMELNRWCRENGYNLYEDGLKVYTTLSTRLQQHAESAVQTHMPVLQQQFMNEWKIRRNPWGENKETIFKSGIKRSDRYKNLKNRGLSEAKIMENFKKPVEMTVFSWKGEIDTTMTPMDSVKYYKKFLQAGFMVMEPNTGRIRAWVGGINYKHFQYDHVNKQAKRQVGSTFKPFVYTVGIRDGYSPCYKVPNVKVVFDKEEWGLEEDWIPKNSDNKYGGMVPLKLGMAQSMNTVTSYLIKQVGPKPVVQLARRMGIDSELPAVPSLALGTADISVYEMVGAFNTYPSKGVWVEPYFISRIEDNNGNVLQEFVPKKVEVLNPGTDYVMLKMLERVTRGSRKTGLGTAVRLRGRYKLWGQMGGKTGTTQNNSDGWFIGVTPRLSGGAWVGAEDRSVHFKRTALGQGANMALPIWGHFLNNVYADTTLNFSQGEKFWRPEGKLPVEMDCSQYQQAESLEGSSGDDALFQ